MVKQVSLATKWPASGVANETYLLTADEVDAMAGRSDTHFLNPNAKRVIKSLGDATGLTGLGIHIFEVQPGDETTELHMHYVEDEAVFILSGTATAVIGSDEFPIAPGDFIGYRKGGLAHTIRNTGPDVLRYLVIGERRQQDVRDYPDQGKRYYRNGDEDRLLDGWEPTK